MSDEAWCSSCEQTYDGEGPCPRCMPADARVAAAECVLRGAEDVDTVGVTVCGECPFLAMSHYDSCTIERCGHASAEDECGDSPPVSLGSPPDWCPLRVRPALVRLRVPATP